MSKGGGGPNQTYSEVQQSTSNLPEWARPYYEDLMARTGYETSTEYTPYEGQRLAYFTPMEQEGMARIGEMGVDPRFGEQMGSAFGMAQQAGQGFDPNIRNDAQSSYRASNYGGPGYSAGQRDMGYEAGQRDMGYEAGNIENQYQAGTWSDMVGDYEAGSRDVGFDPGSLADQDAIAKYMSPYMQNVVDVEKREAARQADMRHQQLGLGSAQAGGPRGNYRLGILEGETERDLGQNMADIQTRGLQSAWGDAKDSFLQDRAGQAQLEQFEQSQFQMNEAAKQYEANLMSQGFSQQEAANQAMEQFRQGAFGLSEQARQQMEAFGQQQFGLNEQMRQQQEQFGQSQFGLNEQMRQMAKQLGLSEYQAEQAAQQAQASLGLQAFGLNQQGDIARAQNLLGQQQNAIAASQLMGSLTGQDQAMAMDRYNAMLGVGGMERGLMQQSLDMGYQDFLRQQAWPREQLAFYSNILQGSPVQPGQTTATYGPQPSYGQQMLGMGLGGLGMWNAMQGGG